MIEHLCSAGVGDSRRSTRKSTASSGEFTGAEESRVYIFGRIHMRDARAAQSMYDRLHLIKLRLCFEKHVEINTYNPVRSFFFSFIYTV